MKAKSYLLNAVIAVLFLSNSVFLLSSILVFVDDILFMRSFERTSFQEMLFGLRNFVTESLILWGLLVGFLLMICGWLFYIGFSSLGLREERPFRIRMAILFLLCIALIVTPAYFLGACFSPMIFV